VCHVSVRALFSWARKKARGPQRFRTENGGAQAVFTTVANVWESLGRPRGEMGSGREIRLKNGSRKVAMACRGPMSAVRSRHANETGRG